MVLEYNPLLDCGHPAREEKVQATTVIAPGWTHVFKLQAAGCQFDPVRAFICGATVLVPGPRSFSKTTPLWVTTKVLTPDDWYSTGYATKVKPPFFLPRSLAPDAESPVT